jgi:hypothetical protein
VDYIDVPKFLYQSCLENMHFPYSLFLSPLSELIGLGDNQETIKIVAKY